MTEHDQPNQPVPGSDARTRVVETLSKQYARAATPPRATYRVQFHAGFTFNDAREIVPYLAALGVDTLYASPIFKANPGSMHGYDVTDFGELNPELGSREEFERLSDELRRHEMRLLLDFVPNHMGIAGGNNRWWQDVLENGRTSAYGEYFDIDWRPIKRELRDQVLLPVLGGPYGDVLERGELTLLFDPAEGSFTVDYFQTPLPIAPPTYPLILQPALDQLARTLPEDDLTRLELESLITAFDRLPANNERDPELVQERRREQIVDKRRLATLVESEPAVAAAVVDAVAAINGQVGDPASFDQLDQLLDAQSYRLAYWRVAAEEINYRRFFAINELAAIRQELPEVFAATHTLLLDLIGQGRVSGVRIDHIDGLWDPAGYLHELQREAFLARCHHDPAATSSEWTWEDLRAALTQWWEENARGRFEPGEPGPIYLVVEKILEPGEELPAGWPCHGTVGYEFARLATGLFVDNAERKAFDTLYRRFSRLTTSYDDLVYANKKLIMRVALASEVNVLALQLNRISEQRRRTRDFTLNALRDALREIIACFPIYRTYVVCDEEAVRDADREAIESAVSQAKRRNPASDLAVFDFLRDVLLLRCAPDVIERQRNEQCRFSMKFQQLTGAVMAKGVEDTTFYIYNRLTSLNEVGNDPTRFGVSPTEFHRENMERRRRWPQAMLASSTHDTKRGEDVRARIDVLSEMPKEWRAAINRWARLNRRFKTKVDGLPAPDRNDEYLLYQTILGVWPFGLDRPDEELVERLVDYMLKAIHEAQVHTSWINPNAEYDAATERFVRAVLDPATAEPFLDDLAPFRQKVALAGVVNSLSQQLLKLTAPGVPDLYQGTELWNFSLVDPDNRRPVDFYERAQLLDRMSGRPDRCPAADLLAHVDDGRIKLSVTHQTLAARAALPELFQHGTYRPLPAGGMAAGHVIAFARRDTTDEVVIVVPRLVLGLTRGQEQMPLGREVWG
ncbi:MAG TPA: malto-oligosyltrehalose synthase, partial [Thermomicrobiales bacterium]|nr:malto-oligosyltrehalose synthase [Thermomicrobiales bacterium]